MVAFASIPYNMTYYDAESVQVCIMCSNCNHEGMKSISTDAQRKAFEFSSICIRAQKFKSWLSLWKANDPVRLQASRFRSSRPENCTKDTRCTMASSLRLRLHSESCRSLFLLILMLTAHYAENAGLPDLQQTPQSCCI